MNSWYHTGDVWADRDFDEKYENIPAQGCTSDRPPGSYSIQLCETVKKRWFVRVLKARGDDINHPRGEYEHVWHIWVQRDLSYVDCMKILKDLRKQFPAINKENRWDVFDFIVGYEV